MVKSAGTITFSILKFIFPNIWPEGVITLTRHKPAVKAFLKE
jgi:hypothetical protein